MHSERIQSPCTKICCLDDADICIGCKRSLDEILAWASASDEQRSLILENCDNRKMLQVKQQAQRS